MNTKLFQLIRIASVISLPVVLTDTQAQDIETQLGESYFKVDQAMTYALDRHELEPVSEASGCGALLPHSSMEWGSKSDLSFEFHDSVEFQRCENALRTFASSAKKFEMPNSYELTHADLLLARWDTHFTALASTDLLPQKFLLRLDRPDNEHFELVLTSRGLELHVLKSKSDCARCRLPRTRTPAQRLEVIPMNIHSQDIRDSNLVLVPKQSRLLPLYVILSNDGTARTAMNPNDEFFVDHNSKNTWANSTEKFSTFLSAVD